MRRFLTLFSVFLVAALFLPAVVAAQEPDEIMPIPIDVATTDDDEDGENQGSGMTIDLPEVEGEAEIAGHESETEWAVLPADEVFGPGGWSLEGVEVEEFTAVPSTFGLWWRSVKETVTTAFTFNPLKKAELRVKYAEERMRLAELIAEKAGDDPKLQKRAGKMVDKAHRLMEQVTAKYDKWFDPEDGKAQKLIGNITRHQLNKEAVMDRLEENLDEEQLDKIRELREKGLQGSQRLLNAIENENIPERVREHLQGIKDRIEDHASEVREYREQKRELLEQRKAGEEGAEEGLRELRRERLDRVKERVQERRELRPRPRPDLDEPGDDEADDEADESGDDEGDAEDMTKAELIDGAAAEDDETAGAEEISGAAGQAEEVPMED
ncbi:hypothetical protein AMJ57_04880 [Parcubacteria bacterium SG8_24]|nr:MAG: hypothetical protein AMJ57_04880 [Parcubacteria bacterium SG8_24]